MIEMADELAISRRETDLGQEWVPRQELLTPLLEMGMSINAAKRGLYYTGNSSVDAAASWVFDNIDSEDLHSPFEIMLESEIVEQDPSSSHMKMVFIVNSELKMGVGKIAAQVAHAGLKLQKVLLQGEPSYKKMLTEWEETGSTKIVLKGNNAAQLMDMEIQAKESRIPCDIVVDAGRTQVAPASITALCLFGQASDVNQITGQLPLL